VIALGSSISAATAGVFGVASMLLTMPMYFLLNALVRVTLPALAGLAEVELQRRVFIILRTSAAVTAPVLIWIAALAPSITWLALGKVWVADTVVIIRWLAVANILGALFAGISHLDVIRDRP